jgi:nucleoside-triphosphatase
METKRILLTGEPGVGKSTLITKILANYPSLVTGIVAQEIREDGERVGFSSGSLENPSEVTIAHIHHASDINVGPFGVNRDGLDQVADILKKEAERAMVEKKVLVFDEIAPMQIASEKLALEIAQVIASALPAIMTIKLDDSEFPVLQEYKRTPGVELIEVTEENRDSLFDQLSDYLFSQTNYES